MRKILFLSLALTGMAAMLTGPALAQRDDNHGRGGGGPHGGPPAAAARGPAPAPHAAPPGHAAAMQHAAPAPGRAAAMQPAQQQRAQRDQAQRAQFQNNRAQAAQNNARPDSNRGGNNNRPQANRGNNGRPSVGRNDNRGGNNGAHRPNPRYNQYHRAFNAPRHYRYRGGAYRRPAGWYYRRWSFGDFLPSLFWASNYWINDWNYYDLMPPPPGTVWVRYGDDAVLIDRYTGEVIQVEYGIFY